MAAPPPATSAATWISKLAAPLLALALVSACGEPHADNAAIAADFQQHRSNLEVTAVGDVIRLLPDRASTTGTHEQFIIRLTGGQLTIEVEHNISIGARVPARIGDQIVVHGEYVWNSQGGLIHFTHHDPSGKHEGGYIIDNGRRYD